MAEVTTTTLNADAHLTLDQPLVRLPLEFARKNLRSSRALVERFQSETNAAIDAAQKAAQKPNHTASATITSLDTILTKAENLKRKLESLQAEERTLQRQQKARLRHLQALHEIPSLVDVEFDRWSGVRLDRMLVDHLLRTGNVKTAKLLAKERKIEDLVDVDVYMALGNVEQSLRQERTTEALAWCVDNRRALKEAGSNLELELRMQQMVEMTRTGDTVKLIEATAHARKYFGGQQDGSYGLRAGGLLAHHSSTLTEPYRELYSLDRWSTLADLFVRTYEQIFLLPQQSLLNIALSAGLSALKTPACHSQYTSSTSSSSSITRSVCPICSTELNRLAENVPYAHHTKSSMENDPVMLPNGRVYGRGRLLALNEKLRVPEGKIRDPTDITSNLFDATQLKKVYVL